MALSRRATTSAERMRRYRERRRAGRRVVQVELDMSLVEDALVVSGLLPAARTDDDGAVAAAAGLALAQWAEERLALQWALSTVTRNAGEF